LKRSPLQHQQQRSPRGWRRHQALHIVRLTGRRHEAGLSTHALIHVEFDGDDARELARYDFDNRVREVEQGPNGAIWVLEDGEDGRLLRLTPGG